MLALHHWYYRYPNNLRRSYYSILGLCWVVILLIIGTGKYSEYRARQHRSSSVSDTTSIVPIMTIRYSQMAPPPSLSGSQVVADVALPEAALAHVEDPSSVPLPVPDELADAATMATQTKVAGVAAPAATGTSGPVVILPETSRKEVYDDNKPAPIAFKYTKSAVKPEPIKLVQPDYPENARRLNIEGTATLYLWLRKDGTVATVSIFKSSGSGLLDTSAARAALKSTFSPAKGADGNPVNVWVSVPFRFSLTGSK